MNKQQKFAVKQRLAAGKWKAAVNMMNKYSDDTTYEDILDFLKGFDMSQYRAAKPLQGLLQGFVDGDFEQYADDTQAIKLHNIIEGLNRIEQEKKYMPYKPFDWNALAQKHHAAMVANGFGDKTRETAIVLIMSELMEAVEADRKGKRADYDAYLATYNELLSKEWSEDMETWNAVARNSAFRDHIKDTVEDEIADACLRICDLAAEMGITLEHRKASETKSIRYTSALLTSNAYTACCNLLYPTHNYTQRLNDVLAICEYLAVSMGMDLLWHLKAKMQYNASRPAKHGKKY